MKSDANAGSYRPRFAAESYIWIQYFHARHRSLSNGIPEMCQGFRYAGFRAVELDSDFLTEGLRTRTLRSLRDNGLALVSVYANSAMHTRDDAKKSILNITALAEALRNTGFQMMITDPAPRPDHKTKSTGELALQAESLNTLGRNLQNLGIRLLVHHHTPELADHAREWRYELAHTDPQLVGCVVDVDWAFRGRQQPLAFIEACGERLAELHLRNDRNGVWMEDFGPGQIDYQPIAQYLHRVNFRGLLVVELAYEKSTRVTRSLPNDLRRSRVYAEHVFQ